MKRKRDVHYHSDIVDSDKIIKKLKRCIHLNEHQKYIIKKVKNDTLCVKEAIELLCNPKEKWVWSSSEDCFFTVSVLIFLNCCMRFINPATDSSEWRYNKDYKNVITKHNKIFEKLNLNMSSKSPLKVLKEVENNSGIIMSHIIKENYNKHDCIANVKEIKRLSYMFKDTYKIYLYGRSETMFEFIDLILNLFCWVFIPFFGKIDRINEIGGDLLSSITNVTFMFNRYMNFVFQFPYEFRQYTYSLIPNRINKETKELKEIIKNYFFDCCDDEKYFQEVSDFFSSFGVSSSFVNHSIWKDKDKIIARTIYNIVGTDQPATTREVLKTTNSKIYKCTFGKKFEPWINSLNNKVMHSEYIDYYQSIHVLYIIAKWITMNTKCHDWLKNTIVLNYSCDINNFKYNEDTIYPRIIDLSRNEFAVLSEKSFNIGTILDVLMEYKRQIINDKDGKDQYLIPVNKIEFDTCNIKNFLCSVKQRKKMDFNGDDVIDISLLPQSDEEEESEDEEDEANDDDDYDDERFCEV